MVAVATSSPHAGNCYQFLDTMSFAPLLLSAGASSNTNELCRRCHQFFPTSNDGLFMSSGLDGSVKLFLVFLWLLGGLLCCSRARLSMVIITLYGGNFL